VECKQLLNNKIEGIKWVKFDLKKKNNALCEDVKCIVIKWWTKETKVNPNMKDIEVDAR
jgi:hypothetical protein